MMTYYFRENLIVMLLWPLHVVVAGFCLFVLSWTLFQDFFASLGSFLSRHTCALMVSNMGWEQYSHSILHVFPSLQFLFYVELIYTLNFMSLVPWGVWHMVGVPHIFCGGTRNTLVLTVVVAVQLPSHIQLFVAPGLQQIWLLCPSSSPRICPSSCPLNQWCHPTISSSIALFSFCLQSFPTSGSFPMSWLFASSSQSIGASASDSAQVCNSKGTCSPVFPLFPLLPNHTDYA